MKTCGGEAGKRQANGVAVSKEDMVSAAALATYCRAM
jgi:hypothetical protein